MGSSLTIGVIGGHSWIANEAVIPAIEASNGATLGSVGSRSGATSYKDVVDDPANDAVYIALPNDMHRVWVERAAEAGKHVLCEKPLATTTADARAMFRACDDANVLLAEAYMTEFHPRTVEVIGRLQSGELGRMRHLESTFTFPLLDKSNYRWNPERGGGALFDVGIYCLTPIIAACGADPEVVCAQSTSSPSGVDATTTVLLGWNSGATASVLVSFELPERQSLQVAGTGGRLSVDRPFTPGPNDVDYAITQPNGITTSYATLGANSYQLMVDAFVAAVSGGVPWPRPPQKVVGVVSLIDRIVREAATPDESST